MKNDSGDRFNETRIGSGWLVVKMSPRSIDYKRSYPGTQMPAQVHKCLVTELNLS